MPFCKKCIEFHAGGKFCERCGEPVEDTWGGSSGNAYLDVETGIFLVVPMEFYRLRLYAKAGYRPDPVWQNEFLRECDAILEINPNYAEIWAARGIALSSMDRYNEALAQFDKSIQLKPKKFPLILKAETLRKMGKWQEALEVYEKLTQIEPRWGDFWFQQAKILTCLGKKNEAQIAFEKATQAEPGSAQVWLDRAEKLMSDRKFAEALTSYENACKLETRSSCRPRCLDGKARALWALRRHEEALAANEEALKLDPSYDGGWNTLVEDSGWNTRGIWLLFLKRYDEALTAFKHTMDSAYETDADGVRRLRDRWNHYCMKAMVMKGFVLRGMGKDAEAEQLFETFSKREHAERYFMLAGTILCSFGLVAEGVFAALRALDLKSDYSPGWYLLGHALNRLGRSEQALVALDSAVRHNPKDWLAWLEKSKTLMSLGKHRDALLAAERSLQLKPNAAEALKARDLALCSLNRDHEPLVTRIDYVKAKPRTV